ncbi:MAG: hypothetical protein CVT89_00365 [Candidatus Altiarchaeales archaeon HGW-Altiarchaeales-2]|nr:MAG: hypothetical protein CVT89_00365 [Candidatus Altiarchaeales archaeon HGW-Altiarchaeales-2]
MGEIDKIELNINNGELPFVSIIVLNYNCKKHLKECFESLERLNYSKEKYEVIMPDNASIDDSVKYVNDNFPWVKVSELNKNYGYSGGNNRGAGYAIGEYIVFLNPDTKVDGNWLIELIKPLLDNKNIKIGGSKHLTYYKEQILSFGGDLTVIGGGTINKKIFFEYDKEYVNAGYAMGTSLLIEKKIFEELGGFDNDYFMYNEEVDLCWRAWIQGYKTSIALTSRLWHKEENFSKKREKFLFHIIKNQLMSVLKNFELHNVIYALIISFFYNSFQIVKYLLLRRPHSIADIIKAHLFVIRNLPEIFKKRRIIQKNRKISDKELYKMGLMLPLSKSIKKEIDLSKREYNGI